MTEPAVSSLQSLARLERRSLTLFLCGTGFGESVLIAVPGGGWLVVDGCGPGDVLPGLALLRRFRSPGEPVDAVLLTHPHADHCSGILDLLDDSELGPAVRRVGCVAEYVGGDPDNTAGRELEAYAASWAMDDPSLQVELGRARAVLERIRAEWEDSPSRRLPLRHGTILPLSSPLMTASVLWPEVEAVKQFFTAPGLPSRIRAQTNRLSVVLDLHFGQTRLLLGGDLPYSQQGRVLELGWQRVGVLSPGLHAHTAKKVPHHGSLEAVAPEWSSPAPGGVRYWAVTPYNKGRKLPAFGEGEGAWLLLQSEREFHLTGLPVGFSMQRPLPDRIRRLDVQRELFTLRGPRGLLGQPVVAGRSHTIGPTDCVWALTFDDQGQVTGRYRGSAATIISE